MQVPEQMSDVVVLASATHKTRDEVLYNTVLYKLILLYFYFIKNVTSMNVLNETSVATMVSRTSKSESDN